jgi:hypothetical protein
LAGFAAWFIAGVTQFSLTVGYGENEQMAVNGTLGFALFLVVFYGMRHPPPKKPQSSVTVDVTSGFTFADTARRIAGADNNVRFPGFTEEQLGAPLLPGKLGPLPTIDALRRLGRMVNKNDFPSYEVNYEEPIYVFQAKHSP